MTDYYSNPTANTSYIQGFPDIELDADAEESIKWLVDFNRHNLYEWVDYNSAIFSIKDNLLSYVKLGMSLHWMRVSEQNLFAKVVRNVLKKTTYYAGKIIKAARIAWELIAAGFETVPFNISQALILEPYFLEGGDNCELCDKWAEILQKAEESKTGNLTIKLIRSVCGVEAKESTFYLAKIPDYLHKELEIEANATGKKVSDLLAEVLRDRYTPKTIQEPEPEPIYTEEQEKVLDDCEKEITKPRSQPEPSQKPKPAPAIIKTIIDQFGRTLEDVKKQYGKHWEEPARHYGFI